MTNLDRRKYPRVALCSEVDLTSGDNFFAGKTRDISLGGLFIETDAGIKVGVVVWVRLALLGEPFFLPCEVTWTLEADSGTGGGVGLRFLSLSARERLSIEAFMRERSPLAFDVAEEDGARDRYGKLPPPLPTG